MRSLDDRSAGFLGVVSERIVPETSRLDGDGKTRFFAIIDEALLDRSSRVRRQIGTFLKLIRLAPVARYGRPFDRLPPDLQDACLQWLENCPVGLLRKGFWGLKALVFLGYYGQTEVKPAIGYKPERDGNRMLYDR